MRAWLTEIRSLEVELETVRALIVEKKLELTETDKSLDNLRMRLIEVTQIPGKSSDIRISVEERKARNLWAKRDAARARLDRSSTKVSSERVGDLLDDYIRLVREAAIQTAFVRGLQLSTYPEVRTLDLRGSAGERELRMEIIQFYKMGYFYSRDYPRLSKQKLTLETHRQAVDDDLKSLRSKRSSLSSSVTRLNRRVRSAMDSLAKSEIRATSKLSQVAGLHFAQTFDKWRSGEMDPRGEDLLAFLERRFRGHPVSKSYLVNNLNSKGLDLMRFESWLGQEFTPQIEPDLVALFLIFCRRFDESSFELLTKHYLKSH